MRKSSAYTNSFNKYYNKARKWAQGDTVDEPAALFLRSDTSELPQIYLFSKFGLSQGAEVNQQSQITTHYTEANNAINDHWALNPIKLTLSGLIGEVIYTPPTAWANFSTRAEMNLSGSLVNLLAPQFDYYTQNKYNIAQFQEANLRRYVRTISQGLSDLNVLKAQTRKSNQEYVFQKLRQLQYFRQLVKAVATPYGWFEDMAVTSLRMSQSGNRFYSNISVEMQEWRDVLPATQRAATAQEKADMAKLQQSLTQNQGEASTTSTRRETTLYVMAGRPQALRPYQNN